MPNLDDARSEQEDEHTRRGCDGRICDDHDETPVPTVDKRTHKGTEQDLRKESYQCGGGQHCGRSGRFSQPPDQGKLNQGGTDQREGLSDPDGEEFGCPAFRGRG